MTALLLILVAARLAGEIAERFGQPAMVGEVAAGILLGPSLLGWIDMTPALKGISELGVFLLLLLAGMEVDLEELKNAFSGRGAWVPLVSFILPFAMGAGVGAAFGRDAMRCLFLGLCMAVTALPVSVRILMDLGRLDSGTGRRIVSSAIANDVIALLVLGVILDAKEGAEDWAALAGSTAWAVLKAAGFLAAVVAAHRAVRLGGSYSPAARGAVERLLRAVRGRETLFAFVILFTLGFASLSEAVGFHGIVGAFFGAALLTREFFGAERFAEVRRTASGVTMGFLAPVFFASVGLQFEVGRLSDAGFTAAVLVAAFMGKMLGGWWGGRLAGLSRAESWALGVGLNGRGIMELVIAEIALSKGFIGRGIFSNLVLMGVATTLVTPILLRRAFARLDAAGRSA